MIQFLDATQACRFLSVADDVKKRLGKCHIHRLGFGGELRLSVSLPGVQLNP